MKLSEQLRKFPWTELPREDLVRWFAGGTTILPSPSVQDLTLLSDPISGKSALHYPVDSCEFSISTRHQVAVFLVSRFLQGSLKLDRNFLQNDPQSEEEGAQ